MRCPICHHSDSNVKDSRPVDSGSGIRRRRICPKCDHRFTTLERPQQLEMFVIKKDGSKVPFDRFKLTDSVRVALRKRPFEPKQLDLIINELIHSLESSGELNISSAQIGEKVMNTLKSIDKIAYVRFASVYRDFREVKDFQEFITDTVMNEAN